MQDDSKLTKKERKELRKNESLQNLEGKKNDTMKWITIGIVAILFIGFFAFIINSSKEAKKQATAAKLTSKGWVRGNKNAKVTLVEFSDFQCPACGFREPMVQQAMKDFDGKIKLLYKHFPLTTVHRNAYPAAKAAEAAGRQEKFWEMHDLLFARQKTWEATTDPKKEFTGYAKELKLDTEKFQKDYEDDAIDKKINSEQDEGIKIGVNATPTFYLNGKIMDTPMSYEDLKKSIEKEL